MKNKNRDVCGRKKLAVLTCCLWCLEKLACISGNKNVGMRDKKKGGGIPLFNFKQNFCD